MGDIRKQPMTLPSKSEKSKMEKDSSPLPPCNVCGDASSGLHFGAMTCEACKVFFLRSIDRRASYMCLKSGSCNIGIKDRSYCSFCRLQKCIMAGMSKSGSKRGRRSNRQKQDIKQKENERNIEPLEETIHRLKELHKRFQMITPEVLEYMKADKTRKQVNKEVMEEISNPMSAEEVIEFYKETGIDLSGSIPEVTSCARNCLKKYATTYIDYLKHLKEFMDLSLPDRVVTLKGGAIIWTLVSAKEIWHLDDNSVSCIFCGTYHTMCQVSLLEKVGVPLKWFACIKKLEEQNLSEDEQAVFRAFVIFDASQIDHEVAEPEKISAIQEHFLECLLHILAKTRGKENVAPTFAKLIEFIANFRESLHDRMSMIHDVMNTALSKVITQDIKYSRIFGEVYSLPENYLEDLDRDFSSMNTD